MRTATIGNSLMGLFEARSVVVAASCFSAGCNDEDKKLLKQFLLMAMLFFPVSVRWTARAREAKTASPLGLQGTTFSF